MPYLYGLLEADPRTASMSELTSIAGTTGQVSVDRCGDLSVIHGPHDGAEMLPRRRLLLSHARVLETAMVLGTVLPMRFGMTCESLAELGDLVSANRAVIRGAIDRLRGQVEIGVRVAAPEDDALSEALSANPAVAAARARLAQQGGAGHFAKVEFGRALGEAVAVRRKAAQKALLADLVPRSSGHVLKAPESDFEALRAEFLIDAEQLAGFLEYLERAVAKLDFAGPGRCGVRVVGPGPAFHFVDLSLVTSDAQAAA